ncbi:MAG: acetyl-CoA carboxylase biotin carboxyl carrier protein [Lachnospiraceae bacterium]|nr:acetyl-CoA carboxylase biotin carboxyl carrier protein [Lachnospiraceae bacterium]
MEFENLIRLIETVSRSELTGLKYEEGGVKLHLTKKQGPSSNQNMIQVQATEMSVQSAPTAQPEALAAGKNGKIVESPLVGTFYAAPAEDAEPFVSVGDTVKKGQTLAIVEAMKLMNEIESDYDGTVAEIYVENGQTVEYGQELFRIE